jgi:hypothetical protein
MLQISDWARLRRLLRLVKKPFPMLFFIRLTAA